jgi:hypothetical protein
MADVRDAMASLATGTKKAPKATPKVEPKSEMTERIIDRPKRGSDGLFEQPEPEKGNDKRAKREVDEQRHRLTFAELFNYADITTGNPATFDPTGKYVCGGCNKFYGKDKCTIIKPESGIDANAGGCAKWDIPRASDTELDIAENPKAATAESVAYGVSKKAKFGCQVCPFAEKANELDSQRRDTYCKQMDARVYWNACCTFNGVEVEGYFEGNKLSKEEAEESYESPEEEATEHTEE